MRTKQQQSPIRVFLRTTTARKSPRNKQRREFPLRTALIGLGSAITVASAVGAAILVVRNAREQVVLTEELLEEEFDAHEEAALVGAAK